jgi:hypothetical protein
MPLDGAHRQTEMATAARATEKRQTRATLTPSSRCPTASRHSHVTVWFCADWEASEREGQHIVQLQRHTDWHRVERTLERFGREIEELKEQVWRET